MIQVCIDESGDTGFSKKSSRYFVVATVITEHLDIPRRIARDVYKHKITKKRLGMLHAYAENNVTKNRLAKKIMVSDITAVAWVFKKEENQGKDIYLLAMQEIARYFKDKECMIMIAKRDTRKSYTKKIIEIYENHRQQVAFSDPARDKSLQIADFFAWSIFSKLEKGNDVFFNKMKNIITIFP